MPRSRSRSRRSPLFPPRRATPPPHRKLRDAPRRRYPAPRHLLRRRLCPESSAPGAGPANARVFTESRRGARARARRVRRSRRQHARHQAGQEEQAAPHVPGPRSRLSGSLGRTGVQDAAHMGGGRDPPGPAPDTNCSSRAAHRKTRADSRPRKCRRRSPRPAEPTSGRRRRRRPHRPLAEAACRAACREDLARPAPRPCPAPWPPLRPPLPARPGGAGAVSGPDLGRPSLTQPDLACPRVASVPG